MVLKELGDVIERNSLPNENSMGNPIATSEQSLKNFWNWFGNSKVIDKNGRPLVMHRGDESDRALFDFSHNAGVKGTYWTSDYNNAKSYVDNGASSEHEYKVHSCYVSVNKLMVQNEINDVTDWNFDDRYLIAHGYDGVAHFDKDNNVTLYVFEPSNVKSVDNGGSFSTSTNIYESVIESLQSVKDNNPDVELAVYQGNKAIVLSKIMVTKENRGKGLAKKAMQDLIQYADGANQVITLTPSSDFGSNKKKLTEFYKQFGFVENKGKHKNFEISDVMYREPTGISESVYSELCSKYLIEFNEPWKNRIVKNVRTGRMTKVGSLAPEDQEKYKPKELRSKGSRDGKKDLDDYDLKNKLVFDMYVSMPDKYDGVDEFLEENPRILATTSSSDVIEMFNPNDRVLKFYNVPIGAIKRYCTLTDDNTDMDDADFKDFKHSDPEKRYDFIKFNEYRLFEIEPKDFMDKIEIVDDTPDETGFVDKRKNDRDGLLESLEKIIYEQSRERVNKDYISLMEKANAKRTK